MYTPRGKNMSRVPIQIPIELKEELEDLKRELQEELVAKCRVTKT